MASATSSITVFAPRMYVAEQRQVEHRQALVPLEHDERDERTAAITNQPDDPGRAPAVVVRLDQRVREREQADPGRDEPGHVGRCSCEVSLRLVERTSAATIATMPIGTLMKKIQLQSMCSVMSPPTSGPIASASADTPTQMPIAIPR